MPDVGVVIAAGGKGRRMGSTRPKQFLRIGREMILERTVAAFQHHGLITSIVVVVPKRFVVSVRRALPERSYDKVRAVVAGGRERQDSVRRGLEAFEKPPHIVLVHDGVRPLIDGKTITAVIDAAARYGAAVVATPLTDTVKMEGKKNFAERTLPRHRLWAVQTPQGFRYRLLLKASRAAQKAGYVGTDEASLVERLGRRVRLVVGSADNIKITTPKDLVLAGFLSTGRR